MTSPNTAKHAKFLGAALALTLGLGAAACSSSTAKSPDVAASIRTALDQAGLKEISITQDRDKGVITLSGTTASQANKEQADTIAKSIAGSEVVADQVAVNPPGDDGTAKKVDADIDKGIADNLDAALVGNKLSDDVKYDVKNGVVKLTGVVHSENKRALVERIAAGVPNVKQVVNELDVKDQKASSTQR
jgi:hyperosmotically inducible protein